MARRSRGSVDSEGSLGARGVVSLPALGQSASESQLQRVPLKEMPIRTRAQEMTALKSMFAHSGTGTLQHDHLNRLYYHLEQVDSDDVDWRPNPEREAAPRNTIWASELLARDAEKQRDHCIKQQHPRPQKEWRLKQGQWIYVGPPEDWETLSADEAMEKFREEELRRGRGPQYRNGIAAPGQMRRFHKRNPAGGFLAVT
mmetsp:Transcript_58807/g.137335  ORF Transcript_58807/g.137335 Transcript_58807/m.137335 type:complete len:200 (+) Transcript_58807:52-651(+)